LALALGVAILVGPSDAWAQAPSGGRAYGGVFGGIGIQTGSGPPGDPIEGIGPTVGGSIGGIAQQALPGDSEASRRLALMLLFGGGLRVRP
jgi:hypothetical protein